MTQLHYCLFVFAVLFVINRCVDACFLADMFIQALLGFLDKKKNRWEGRPRVTIMTYCKHWLAVDMLSVVPYDAIVILVPSHLKLKVMLGPVSWHMCVPLTCVVRFTALVSKPALSHPKKQMVPSRICCSCAQSKRPAFPVVPLHTKLQRSLADLRNVMISHGKTGFLMASQNILGCLAVLQQHGSLWCLAMHSKTQTLLKPHFCLPQQPHDMCPANVHSNVEC